MSIVRHMAISKGLTQQIDIKGDIITPAGYARYHNIYDNCHYNCHVVSVSLRSVSFHQLVNPCIGLVSDFCHTCYGLNCWTFLTGGHNERIVCYMWTQSLLPIWCTCASQFLLLRYLYSNPLLNNMIALKAQVALKVNFWMPLKLWFVISASTTF